MVTYRTVVFALAIVALVGASLALPAARAQNEQTSYVAILSGGSQVEPVATQARGQAFFQLSEDGMEIRYRLIVANIRDVLMAHIHAGPSDGAGPVVVWLYPSAPPPALIPGRSDGILAAGSFDTGDLVGPLAGMSLSDLVDLMNAGGTYVNVHTQQYPGGEIRGQIFPAA